MDDDTKFKYLMFGTVGIVVLLVLYLGLGAIGSGFFSIDDENATNPLADCNASLINCRAEVSSLIKTSTQQSNTITSVNDQLVKAKNERDKSQADLNSCDANSLNIKITANEYNIKFLDANTARMQCESNLNSALNLRTICLSDQNILKAQLNDTNTKLNDANTAIINLQSTLAECNALAYSQAQLIPILNSKITDLNAQFISCSTEKQQLTLDLTTTKEYLCNFDGNYCCDLNSSWMWC